MVPKICFSHLLKTLIYLASDHCSLLVFLPGQCFLILSVLKCWNYSQLNHPTSCFCFSFFFLQMALNTIYILVIPLFVSPSWTFPFGSRILYTGSNSNSSFGCLIFQHIQNPYSAWTQPRSLPTILYSFPSLSQVKLHLFPYSRQIHH